MTVRLGQPYTKSLQVREFTVHASPMELNGGVIRILIKNFLRVEVILVYRFYWLAER